MPDLLHSAITWAIFAGLCTLGALIVLIVAAACRAVRWCWVRVRRKVVAHG